MTWSPITLGELQTLVAGDLAACAEDLRAFFGSVAFQPAKWRQSPWGTQGGGFWAVGAHAGRVLWYNDIECGFNVSRFLVWGVIPDDEYWSNQDPLGVALAQLAGNDRIHMGSSQPQQRE